jgi:hypothetical protein
VGGWLRPGAFAAFLTVLLAGCFPFGYLFPDPISGPIPTFCEDLGPSGPGTAFGHLSATVVLTGGESLRAELGPVPGGLGSGATSEGCGPYVHGAWTDPKGDLVLSVDSTPGIDELSGMPSPSAASGVAISLERPHDKPPVVFFDFPDAGIQRGCMVTLTEASTSGLVGHADCPGVWWHSETEEDPFAPAPSGTVTFDLSIDFSALP